MSLYRIKTLFKVVDNIVNVFGTHRKPDGGGLNSRACQLFGGQLGMSGGGGVDYKGFHVRHIGKEGKQLQRFGKPLCLFLGAL